MEFIHEKIRNDIKRLEWTPYEDGIFKGISSEYNGLKLYVLSSELETWGIDENTNKADESPHKIITVYNFSILSGKDPLYDSFLEDMSHGSFENVGHDYETISQAKDALYKKLEEILIEEAELKAMKMDKKLQKA